MKNINKILSLILLLTTITLVSCTQDDPISPSSDSRAKYLGSWNVTETQVKVYYEAVIKSDANAEDRVRIENFAGLGTNQIATAFISGNNITLDPNQNVANFIINGSGVISGTTITWSYSINDGADLLNYSAIFTKK